MAASDVARRTIVATAAIPVVVGIVYVGDVVLAAFLAAVSAIAAWEFYRLAEAVGATPLRRTGVVIAAALPIVTLAHVRGFVAANAAMGAVVMLGLLAATLWLRRPERGALLGVAATVLGLVYTGGMLSFGCALRYNRFAVGDRGAGLAVVMFPVVLAWASDTGAFFVGRAFGRRKLLPHVSPAKTVAGAVGGLVAVLIVGQAYARVVLPPVAQVSLRPIALLIFTTLVGVSAQLGDLVESMLKREAGVKDSSRILPGHGGVLDRVDSLLFVLPLAYLLLDQMLVFRPA